MPFTLVIQFLMVGGCPIFLLPGVCGGEKKPRAHGSSCLTFRFFSVSFGSGREEKGADQSPESLLSPCKAGEPWPLKSKGLHAAVILREKHEGLS